MMSIKSLNKLQGLMLVRIFGGLKMVQAKSQIQYEEGMFKTNDGLNLYEQRWQPGKQPKAVIVIIHGYAEHSGRHVHVADYLVNHGYTVETFDLRSHGRSEGKNTHIRSFDEFLSDVDLFLKRVKERHPNKNLFLLGHSMGGTIAVLFAITRKPDLKGIILTGATLKISDEISPFLVRISSILGKLVPKLPTIKIDCNAISRDPEVVKKYDNDPLVYRGGIPARTGAEFTRATKLIQKQMEFVTLPLLILSGTADRLSDPEGSKQLYEQAQSKDKTLKLYDGFYHEILNEPEKKKVLADIVEWLEVHVQ
jgi:acylglycerol lipase